VQSEVRDVLTLNAATTDPYTVTFELDVDGVVTGSGSARANAFLDFGLAYPAAQARFTDPQVPAIWAIGFSRSRANSTARRRNSSG
jgi:hypothetical protein